MDDDQLGEALRRALRADDGEVGPPPADRVEALRAAVERAAAAGGRRTAPERRSRRALVVALVAAGVAVLVAVGAVAASPPSPVRDAARSLGLPVDSNELLAARRDLHRLGAALAATTTSPGAPDEGALDAVAVADASMLRDVAALDVDEKRDFVVVAHQVHLRAVALFVEQGMQLPTAKPADLAELDVPTSS